MLSHNGGLVIQPNKKVVIIQPVCGPDLIILPENSGIVIFNTRELFEVYFSEHRGASEDWWRVHRRERAGNPVRETSSRTRNTGISGFR